MTFHVLQSQPLISAISITVRITVTSQGSQRLRTPFMAGHTAAGVSLTCRQFAFQVSLAWPLNLQQPQAQGSQVCSPTPRPKYRSCPSSTQNLRASSFPREKLRQERKAGIDGDIRRTGWGEEGGSPSVLMLRMVGTSDSTEGPNDHRQSVFSKRHLFKGNK